MHKDPAPLGLHQCHHEVVPFKLWFSCPHPYVVTPDGAWHRPECRLLRGINANDLLRLPADERLAVSPAPTRCPRCYPETRIVGAPPE